MGLDLDLDFDLDDEKGLGNEETTPISPVSSPSSSFVAFGGTTFRELQEWTPIDNALRNPFACKWSVDGHIGVMLAERAFVLDYKGRGREKGEGVALNLKNRLLLSF